MVKATGLKPVDGVDLLTLQDDTIDLTVMDNSGVIQCARPLVGLATINTVEASKGFNPQHGLPAHCTGRKAMQLIAEAPPDAFILPISGTRLTFRA